MTPVTIGLYASQMLYLDKKVLFWGSFEQFCHSPEMAAFFGEYSSAPDLSIGH